MFNILHNSSTALNAAVTIALLGFIWYWIYGRGTRGGTKQGGILGSNPFVSFFNCLPISWIKFTINMSVFLVPCAQIFALHNLHGKYFVGSHYLIKPLFSSIIHPPGLRLLITKLWQFLAPCKRHLWNQYT